jgi:eukaryotic-like serine/threonine-protein kinase
MLGQPMLGRILGSRYQVSHNLSAGGFGRTYIVQDSQRPGHPQCVLKHLSFSSHNPDLLQQARRMFQHEAEVLEHLGQHDRIPRLLAYFEEAGEFYLVQELIEGRSLSEELQTGKTFPVAEVVAILEDVLEILQFVHGQGVIHRDLKPENLIRRRSDGKLVLIDFGAVKTMDVLSTMPDHARDNASVPVYTTGYAASEQCLGQPRFASDLYALGMIAVQAITGIHPTQLPTDPDTGNPVWPAPIDNRIQAILQRLTAFHFAQRYQSAIEVQQSIRNGFSNYNTTFIPPEDAPIPDNPRRRIQSVRPRKLLPIVLFGVGTIVAALFATQRIHLPLNNSGNLIATSTLPISQGAIILSQSPQQAQKQAAAAHIAKAEFAPAIDIFQTLRQADRHDPEVLIYLNNAKIGKANAYTIAAVMPLQRQPNFANEVLRGVARWRHCRGTD